jgi:transcriptional regulator with XRE-family HTH domain
MMNPTGLPVRPGASPGASDRVREVIVLRREIGDVLRDARLRQGRTLREVSSAARVSLGYLSEVERGQKEASSELLSAICEALDLPLSLVLREVSDRVAVAEGLTIPDTIPAEFVRGVLGSGPAWRDGGDPGWLHGVSGLGGTAGLDGAAGRDGARMDWHRDEEFAALAPLSS